MPYIYREEPLYIYGGATIYMGGYIYIYTVDNECSGWQIHAI